MKCSAFIAASVDGFIATTSGGVDWLDTAGNPESGDRPSIGDGGFSEYLSSVDCMIMGRRCMEKIASFTYLKTNGPMVSCLSMSQPLTQGGACQPGSQD